MKRFYILLALFLLVSGSLVFYLSERFPDVLRVQKNQIHLVSLSVMLLYLILGWISRKSLGTHKNLQYGMIWAGIFCVILVGYSFQPELQKVFERTLGHVVPSQGTERGETTMEFPLSDGGHYLIEAKVNGVSIRFLVDTGATRVVLTPQDARRLGYSLAELDFTQLTSTANGQVFSAPITLEEIQIGSIRLKDIPASVSQSELHESLLGMSFLSRLESWSVIGNKLILKGK